MSLQVWYRAVIDCQKALVNSLFQVADIDKTVAFCIPKVPSTEEAILKREGRQSIISSGLYGTKAFSYLTEGLMTNTEVDDAYSRVYYRPYPGVIIVPEIDKIIGYVQRLNQAKSAFEAQVSRLVTTDAKFEAVHALDYGVITKMVYRKVHEAGEVQDKVHFNFSHNSSSKNYTLDELIQQRLACKERGGLKKGWSRERWHQHLVQIRQLVETQYRDHKFRTWRQLSVSPEMALIAVNGARRTVTAGLPLIVKGVETEISPLVSWYSDASPGKSRGKYRQNWEMICPELSLYGAPR